MIKNIKTIWKLACKHWRAFVHDVDWHFSHAKFYAKRISAHFKNQPYNHEEHSYWLKPPLDPVKYSFDKEKADAALYEVRQWISEDTKPKGK